MLEPHTPERPDDLKQRYLQASAEQAVGPSERVRAAAIAHAQAVAAGTANEVTIQSPQVAANRSRWNTPLVASLAIASISALLALQFDRGERADKQVVLGTPSVTARSESASATAPSASAPAPAQALPPQATAEVPPQPAAALPAPALPAPTSPARALPAPSQVTTTKSEPAAKRATPPDASIAQPAAPAAAPAPAPAPEPASTAAKSTASADKVEPAPAKPGAAGLASGSENMTADRAASGRLAAPQSKAAPSLDAERSGQASARSDSSSTEAPAAMRSRPAVAAPAPTPAPISAPAVPAPAPAAAPAAPPLHAGAALREAARTGQSGALAQALQVVSAAQLNSTDSAGRTALMLATTGGHVEAVQRLVNAGANTELKDANGQTAAQTAKRLGYRQIESILKGS